MQATVSNVPIAGTISGDLEDLISNLRTAAIIESALGDVADELESQAQLARLDQGIVDGAGHLFAAVNAGHLVFIDYSQDGSIAGKSPYLEDGMLPFLELNLDDLAPLVGPGSIPEPSSVAMVGAALLLLKRARRRFRL